MAKRRLNKLDRLTKEATELLWCASQEASKRGYHAEATEFIRAAITAGTALHSANQKRAAQNEARRKRRAG